MMKEALQSSGYFGLILSIFLFLLAVRLKAKFRVAILNPLLVSTIMVIAVLVIFQIPYEDYKASANLLSYLLTPATVCLAIPMYKQLRLLKDNLVAVLAAITAGTLCSILSILIMGKLFGLTAEHIATLLPKSITTAIGMGIAEELDGHVTIAVAVIVVTGVLGNVLGVALCRLFRITHPVAKGLAFGASSHAIGTTKAMELGEVEGAMSGLAIAASGVITVIIAPLFAKVI